MVAAVVTSVAVLAISITYRLAIGQEPSLVAGYELPSSALLLAAAIALGDSLRARRVAQTRASEITALREERLVRQLEQRALRERLGIARELHDSVGHALTVVSLRAQLAEEELVSSHRDGRDDAVLSSVRVIRETVGATFEDLRRTVAGLRAPAAAPAAWPAAETNFHAVITSAVDAGLGVRADVAVRDDLPEETAHAVARVLQESLTNVMRHGAVPGAEVRISENDGVVVVEVSNRTVTGEPQGTGEDAITAGLAGMCSRVVGLGGDFAAGYSGGTFRVRASLPVGGAP